MDIAFLLNGETVELSGVDPTTTVLDWLRETRGLTGTKEGCNEGDCGACTVMVTDNAGTRALNGCILFMPQINGKSLTTVEGLSGPDGDMHPVQQAMVEHHGSQCGFCTPGFVVSMAAGQINGETDHDRQLAGNLCRCTGYAPIVRAADHAARKPVPDWLSDVPPGPPMGPSVNDYQPTTASGLAELLRAHPGATLVAGATDVGLWVNKDHRDLGRVIFVSQIEELRRIEVAPYFIRIGAAASIEALRLAIAKRYPSFAAMLDRFASAQVRAAATVGGNIANGSPIGDTPPPLIALGAMLQIRSGDDMREIPLEDFFIEYGKQDLEEREFVEAVVIPRDEDEDRLKVYKLSKRFDQDISAVLGAFNIHVKDGTVRSARIAFGGMAGTPMRAHAVERALLGKPWTMATIRNAKWSFAEDFRPMSDMRASANYRLEAAANMLERAWREDQGEAVDVREVTP
ncbi:MAG: xanthine dehydrogenase small subunit [Maritimibacter harenae]|jgi:xanthine dehydrogenase small subunit|uniref:2Fe-2S iron-sulfur cluster binding domain-containing protein n=1 Tax=Maritimibacter harenae TaxID=2606218 RepID=A0A845M4X9_9RHOB|nr:xanthine dehydrogenase small subunit [Maritimibacter harenae]MZR12533.1 2Fe-2S iron-sulfur cluster binding domain-containing protein [Maritimibacter harenae]